jgi:hypothetical protein
VLLGEPADHRDELERGAGVLAGDAAQLDDLVVRRVARRHRLALGVVVGGRQRRREAEPTLFERAPQQREHRFELLGLRLAGAPVLAHHHAPDGAVADEEARVHRDAAALDAVEVLTEAAPVERHAGDQRLERHALDARQHPREVVDLAVGHRRDREAAVAADHARDAVQR